ncbi:MAG: lactonase family protein [Bryobacteraceae bacterium]|nr:lactonase family protein [Bryobacteraceae bacterium]
MQFNSRIEGRSRREFLQRLAVAAAAPALARASAGRKVLAYVGTYSSPEGPEGSKGNGQGIHVFEQDPSTGALRPREVIASGVNPSCLAPDASWTHLYSANETATFQGEASGSVSAYSVDRESGHLSLLNTVSSRGAGATYVSVHPSGKHVFVANYHGGTFAVLPVLDGGRLGPASDVKHQTGPVGPAKASSAPHGSFAISGHERTHGHMILSDAAGRFVIGADLGADRLFVWRYDAAHGTLAANDPASVALPPGDGPRHFAFHPNGRWLYSLQEEASTLVAFDYDASKGTLSPQQTVSSLPDGFAGTSFTSEVMVSSDGRFLYAANRLHDSIAWFSIDGSGRLRFVGEAWTRGDYPRSFNIDPAENFLYSCNQRSDAVAAFRVNRETGELKFTGAYTSVGTPSIIVFRP